MNTIVRSLKKNHLIAFVILILSAGNIFGQDSVPGTALNFDGVDDYINCGNPANLSFPGTAPFTLEAWVKPAVNNISGDIITKFNLNVEGEYSLTIRNGKASTHREAPPYNISGTTLLKQDTWYHIASVYDGANLSIYLNGNLENSASSGAITARSTSVIIGAEKQSDNPAVFFNGQIDEVRVWNVARTVEEIREKMAFTLEGWEPGLVSYWQFNEGSGTNAIDPLKGNNGVLINMNDSAWVTSTVPINLFTFYEGFNGISYCSTAWGDYDNDGDLDILLTGGATVLISRIYRNDSGTFTNIDAGLEPVYQGSVAWGDYDNDGDLDILLTGWCSDGDYISSIYRNDLSADGQERVFSDINAGLIGVGYSSVAWGDYDNDGDLDVLLTGVDMSARTISRIYRNDPSADGQERVFSDINAGLIGVYDGSAVWGDYDNDGDLDVLLNGANINGGLTYFVSRIFRNVSGTFTNIDAGLEPVYKGSVAWGDYDNDGDLDVLLTGFDMSARTISRIYRNDPSADGQDRVFTDINAGLIGVGYSSVAWGDYDNDGDLDVLLTGVCRNDYSPSFIISSIYRNDPSADGLDRVFTDINAGLIGVKLGSAAWGDYDKDGDLDILLSGYASDGYYISKIYRNNSVVSNTAPFSPDGLSSTISADSLSFFWNKASDNETPQDGLSYNLIIGNAEYDVFMKSPMADINNGYRTIPAFGNAGQLTSWTYQTQGLFSFFQVIPPDYWGVQAIDHSFAGSALVTDSINIPVSYLPTLNNNIMQPTDLLYWQIQMGDSVTSYQVQIDEDSLFNSCEVNDTLNVSISGSGYYYAIPLQDLARGDVLVAGTKYYWRIKPNYTFGLPTAFTKPAPSFHYMFVTDIDESAGKTIPEKFALHQNYPNPFNPVTTIGFSIARTEHVNLTIFNVKGQEMMTLVDESMAPGSYKAQIDARTWPSGLYFYQLTAGGKQMVKRMILMK
jgi:predicted nucleotidyltransferase